MEKSKPDLNRAEGLLKESLTQFQSDEHSQYPFRIQLRLAKVHYLKDEAMSPSRILLPLGAKITQKRLKMHYYFLLSQTYYKKKEKGLALQSGEKAHEIALGLSARADLARYDEWIQKLKSNR